MHVKDIFQHKLHLPVILIREIINRPPEANVFVHMEYYLYKNYFDLI